MAQLETRSIVKRRISSRTRTMNAVLETLEHRQLMSVVPVPIAVPANSIKLTGTLIGTSGSYQNKGNTIANTVDGNPSTFFDAPAGVTGWAGLDLGGLDLITQVQYVPRSGYASRMVGGAFQGSTTADFSSGVTTLAIVTKAPASNAFTAIAVNNPSPLRYIRYLAPASGSGNVAEIEFDGMSVVPVPVPNAPAITAATALTSGDVKLVWSQDSLAPVNSFVIERQGSDGLGFVQIGTVNGTTTTFDDLTTAPLSTYTYAIAASNAAGTSALSLALVVTTPAASIVPGKLIGTIIGTAGSYRNLGNTIANVFDGNPGTFFDAPTGSGSWVGLDLGSPQAITQVQYQQRNGYASRMVGGIFQASNTADFSAGVITLCTVTIAPSARGFTAQQVSTNGGFRYVRYLSPINGCGNVAEIEFDGLPAPVIPLSPSFPSYVTWANGAASPIVRAEAVGSAVNGKLYVFGGFDNEGSDTTSIPLSARCDVYDPSLNLWTQLANFPEPFTHSQGVVVGTSIWFVGGYLGNHPGPGTTHVWVYDTISDAWSRGPDLPQARGAGAAALVGSSIYFTGGMDATRTIDENTTYCLDLTNQAAGWVQKADLPNGRNHVAAASLGGYFYVIGGQHGQEDGQAAQSEVDQYDPATDSWTVMASLPVTAGKSHITSATLVYNGRIVVVGGETGYNDPQRYIVDYDPATNTWNQLGLLPAMRSTVVAGIINGQLVVTTGNSPSATSTTWIGGLF